jgi:hypothetical protein
MSENYDIIIKKLLNASKALKLGLKYLVFKQINLQSCKK